MKAVLFDFDGVIVDTEPLYYKMLDGIYEDLGIEVDDETGVQSLGCNSKEWWDFIIKKYDLKADLKELTKRETQGIDDVLKDETVVERIFPDLETFLIKLRENGIRCAIASANKPELIKNILKNAGLDGYFETVVSTDEAGRGKPAPDVFLYAAEKLGVDSKDTLVIEDSARGLEGAKRAGMTSLAFLSAPVPVDLTYADLSYSNYDEIIKNLDSLTKL